MHTGAASTRENARFQKCSRVCKGMAAASLKENTSLTYGKLFAINKFSVNCYRSSLRVDFFVALRVKILTKD